MVNFLKSSVLILLLLLVSLGTLSGCSHRTTVSEGNLYLQAQAQQVQITSYKTQLQSTKERLTRVIPQVQGQDPKLPESLLADLTTFLLANDCTKFAASIKDQCYKVTRVKLIEVTRLLDEARMNEYAGQKTIAQLVANITVLIDSMGEPPPPPPGSIAALEAAAKAIASKPK